jgi:hypothetical protein
MCEKYWNFVRKFIEMHCSFRFAPQTKGYRYVPQYRSTAVLGSDSPVFQPAAFASPGSFRRQLFFKRPGRIHPVKKISAVQEMRRSFCFQVLGLEIL